jgi:hypothetical protein
MALAAYHPSASQGGYVVNDPAVALCVKSVLILPES